MTKPISRKMAIDALLYRFAVACVHGDGEPPHITCAICGEIILPGQDIDFDHVHADVFGGPHEYQNLRPLHRLCHRKKTKKDVQANAKVKRLRKPRQKPKRPWRSKPWPTGRKMPKQRGPRLSRRGPPSL